MKTTPILKVVYPFGDFVVCIDACKVWLGGVLMKNDHVICNESRKLKDHERNSTMHDYELEAIVRALKVWRHYLIGKRFLLKTENIGFKYLFE